MQNVKVDRDKYIGGSDIPIIMNISPFRTRWELLQEKAGLIQNDFKGNQYTEYGNVLEPQIRDYINETQKDKFVEGKDIIGDIRCHTDGINKTTVLEIKTTSQIHEKLEEYKVYLVQLLFYMENTKRKKGKLAVYFREDNWDESMHVKEHNFDYEFKEKYLTVYDIDIKDYKDLLEEINLAVDDFRNDLERLKENPFLTESDLEPSDLIELANELEVVGIQLTNITAKYNDLKNQMINKLIEKRKNKFKSNKLRFTRVADGEDKSVEIFDEEKFKEENADFYKKYLKTTIKKGKAGYLKIDTIGD